MPGLGTVPHTPAATATTLSAHDIGVVAYAAGFRGNGLADSIAVALAESSGRTDAHNTNSDSFRSVDRGLWQINSHWHPEVSDAQAYNPREAAKAAYRISNGGKDWHQWATWPAAASAHMPAATLAARAVTQAGGGDPSAISQLGAAAAAVNPLSGFTDMVSVARGFLGMAVKVGAWTSDPHNWLRVAAVAWGAGGVIVALAFIAKSGAAGSAPAGVVKTATGAAKLAVDTGAAVATDGASLAVTGGAKAAKLAKVAKPAKAAAKTAKATA